VDIFSDMLPLLFYIRYMLLSIWQH
jgi:hypothetical protein